MRTFLTRALIALTITTIGAFAADNSIGTWKLNAEKSKYMPAPGPVKSLTVTREASDGGAKVTTAGERADGTPINATYTVKYDGKDVQITGNSPYDTIAVKQVNANTLTEDRKKTGGPYRATSRVAISGGGKTMTVTAKGTDTDAKAFTYTFVFDKQ
jgi:2',3'-cyclic-nucleotide 2'-phosphodiesterase (5'-nucleotidase family)